MTPLFEAAFDLQNTFLQRKWRFCIIGGIALLRWGEARFTRDVDVTLLTGFGREEEFITTMLSSGYRGRIPDAARFALRNRVMLLESQQGIPIDVALAGLPYEEQLIERSSLYEFEPGCSLRTCSAEDLIVLKLFAFRARDVADVESIVARQQASLDWTYMREQLTPLAELKEQPSILETFHKLRTT
jgi:hypothetical protein